MKPITLLTLALSLLLLLACGGGGGFMEPYTDADQNTVLSEAPASPRLLAIDDSNVYFVTGVRGESALWSVPKSGGETVRWAPPGHNTEALLVDETHVYVGTWRGVFRFDKTTKKREQVNSYDGELLEVRGAVLVGDEVWFVTKQDLYRVPKSGAKPTLVARLIEEKSWAWALAVHEDELFYASRVGIGAVNLETQARRKFGKPPTTMTERSPMFIQNGEMFVDASVGGGWTMPLEGGEFTRPCSYTKHFRGFYVDEDNWYYGSTVGKPGSYTSTNSRGRTVTHTANVSRGEGGLMRCGLDSDGKPENLAPSAESVVSIDGDDTHIYWADADTWKILRRAR